MAKNNTLNCRRKTSKKRKAQKISPTAKQQLNFEENVGYTKEDMAEALQMIREGSLSKKGASKLYHIPRQTLQYRLGTKFKKVRKGPQTVLTEEEERVLVKWLVDCGIKGFPKRQLDLVSSVKRFLDQDPTRVTPFTDNKPGPSWMSCFLKRHPELSFRIPEAVTAASANVAGADLQKWFLQIESHLKENNLFDVLQDPTRVFNGDETNFQLCPKNGSVLTLKGSQNVYEVDCATSKSTLTVMFTFSAAGTMIPPMVIYPYVRIPQEITREVPEGWGVGRSESGWMTSETFYEYISRVFIPFLNENKIKTPVILFVDGHKSHLSYHLSELCTKANIVLIALYPNATRILQPADVAAFRPLKQAWRNEIAKWRIDNHGVMVTKDKVAPLLEKALKCMNPGILRNGFRASGLFPWNFHAIDLSKCLGRSNDVIPAPPPPVLDFEAFTKLAGETLMGELEKRTLSHQPSQYEVLCKKVFAFFKLEDPIRYTLCTDEQQEELSVVEGGASVIEAFNPEAINSQPFEFEDVAGTSFLEAAAQTSEGPNAVGTLEEDINDSTSMPQGALEEVSFENDCISMPLGACGLALDEILDWPGTPKRKGTRHTERVPFVLTSQQYKQIHLEKEAKKKKEIELKEQRKRNRENKVQKGKIETTKKGRAAPKTSAAQELEKENDPPNVLGNLCFTCAGSLRKSPAIACSTCGRVFHRSCCGSVQTSEEEIDDDDFYVCPTCCDEVPMFL